jgi:hypothetical protein
MTGKVRMFMHSEIATECDVCHRQFDVVAGGACPRCRRVLCSQHLHGSWVRRLQVDFGAEPVCCACRRGEA